MGWAGFHILLVFLVSLLTTFSLIARGRTLLPSSAGWKIAEGIASGALGECLDESNWGRRSLSAYLNAAGIERGYGFFAPNVPYNHKLAFELYYPDGKIEYDLPEVADVATGKRLANALDYIGHTPQEKLRETLIKMLAYSAWQQHPDAVKIRAVFGVVKMPTVAEFQQGKKESYQFLHVYDLEFRHPPEKSIP